MSFHTRKERIKGPVSPTFHRTRIITNDAAFCNHFLPLYFLDEEGRTWFSHRKSEHLYASNTNRRMEKERMKDELGKKTVEDLWVQWLIETCCWNRKIVFLLLLLVTYKCSAPLLFPKSFFIFTTLISLSTPHLPTNCVLFIRAEISSSELYHPFAHLLPESLSGISIITLMNTKRESRTCSLASLNTWAVRRRE